MEKQPINDAQQLLYLIELCSIIIGCFIGGFLLLGSDREKDQEYKAYGWLMYVAAIVGILFMAILVRGFGRM
jgi:hypothetical protein